MKRKWAAILISGAVAVLIIFRLFSEHKPELAKGPPLLFPPQQEWPANVLTAIEQFRNSSAKPRIEQSVEIRSFFRQYEMKLKENRADPRYIPLTKDDFVRLLGPPDFAKQYLWGYIITSTGTSASWLELYFSKNKLINMGGSVSDGYRSFTE